MVTLTPSLLSVFVAFLYTSVVFGQYTIFSKIELPQGVFGPGSAAFRGLVLTQGPFATVADGRIMKWLGPDIGFVDFAYTTPTRTKQHCDGTTNPDDWQICGRPLALSFNPITGLLYIADAYFGLLVVGPEGGLATVLADGFKFLAGVDVDLLTGNVYFCDISLTYTFRDTMQPGFIPDSTARLLRYNPLTGEVSVLLSGLAGGGGPAVSHDGTFVVYPELRKNRILKYWLAGPKKYEAEALINNMGNLHKIKRAERFNEFWVAQTDGLSPPTPPITPKGVRFNSNGDVLQILSFATEYFNTSITVVQERDGKLYVGSRFTNFIGVYSNN